MRISPILVKDTGQSGLFWIYPASPGVARGGGGYFHCSGGTQIPGVVPRGSVPPARTERGDLPKACSLDFRTRSSSSNMRKSPLGGGRSLRLDRCPPLIRLAPGQTPWVQPKYASFRRFQCNRSEY